MSGTATAAPLVRVDVLTLEGAAAQESEHLHDTLVQDLLATRFLADLVRSRVTKAFAGGAMPEGLADLLDEMATNAATASGRGRAHMNAVKPRSLDGRGLPEALALLGGAVTVTGDLEALEPATAVVAYRLAQAWVTDGCPAVTVSRDGPAVRLDAAPFVPARRSAVWAQVAAGLAPQPSALSISLPAHADASQEEHQ